VLSIDHLIFHELPILLCPIEFLEHRLQNVKINTIDYRHHFLPLEINELLVYLNKLSTLATKSIHLSTEKLMVEDELTSTLIESKIVDIISKQAEMEYIEVEYRNKTEFYFNRKYSSSKNKVIEAFYGKKTDSDVTVILKHCNKLGLELTRKKLNKIPIFQMQNFGISITSTKDICKFYEMCKKGVRIATLQICTNFNDNDMMIETLIKLMKISQTKTKIFHISLGALRPKHFLKVLNELKGTKGSVLQVSGFRVPKYEKSVFELYTIMFKNVFEKLIQESIFFSVNVKLISGKKIYNGNGVVQESEDGKNYPLIKDLGYKF